MTANVLPHAGDTPVVDSRADLADALIDELTGWSPPDRLHTFTRWHRGSLSLVQLIVLTVLEADGPLPMGRLAEALDVSDASATGIVDRMEKRGFVERRHGVTDRREVVVHLVDGGAAIFRDLKQHRRARLAKMVDQLSDDELTSLLVGLRALRAVVVRLHAEKAGSAAKNGTSPDDDTAICAEGRAAATAGGAAPSDGSAR